MKGIGNRNILSFLFIICFALSNVAAAAESSIKESVMESIKQAVGKELINSISGNVEVCGIRIVKGSEGMAGNEEYTVAGTAVNNYSGRNKVIMSVTLSDKRMVTRSILVEAVYDVLAEVFVASRPLAGGSVLTEEDFYTIRQKSSRLPAGAITNKRDIEGKTLKMNIGQGIIMKSDHITAQANIKRGQKVTVIVEGDNVSISTKGMLRGDAVIGGTARVFCDVSRKEVIGILVSPNMVRVKI